MSHHRGPTERLQHQGPNGRAGRGGCHSPSASEQPHNHHGAQRLEDRSSKLRQERRVRDCSEPAPRAQGDYNAHPLVPRTRGGHCGWHRQPQRGGGRHRTRARAPCGAPLPIVCGGDHGAPDQLRGHSSLASCGKTRPAPTSPEAQEGRSRPPPSTTDWIRADSSARAPRVPWNLRKCSVQCVRVGDCRPGPHHVGM